MKEKLKMFDRNSNKGITLIALVITIIVLLILAGVSIATLTGPNGLLTRANQAKEVTEQSGAKEKVQIEVAASYDNRGNLSKEMLNENLKNVQGLTSGIPITTFPATVVVDGYEVTIEENGEVTAEEITPPPTVTTAPTTPVDKETIFKDPNSSNKEAVIPEGFSVSGKTEEQKIDKGLVVIAPDGSEFVWVPVDKTSLCVDGIADKQVAELPKGETVNYRGQLYDFSGTNFTKITYSESSNREPAYLTDPTRGDANISEGHNTIGIAPDTLQNEYNGIIKSIKEHGGFYIGRYESSLSDSNATTAATTGHIQSKKGIMPTSAGNAGTKTWYGLYKKQKEYATEINNKYQTNVKSGMIYGSMYDAVMNWALYGTDKADASKVTASSTMHGPEKTGALDIDVIKNIYDLGNNLYEWTAEAYDTYGRVLRGGGCYDIVSPIDHNGNADPSITYGDYGSRPLLYL